MPDEEPTPDECPYVVGETYAERDTPTFEFKPSATGYTGGGYARVRSIEHGPEVSRPGKGDVFVSIHRLAAVVWCYPEEMPLAEVTADLREHDVHHQLGMPSANLPDELATREHGDHSKITRTQQLAWTKDAKRERQRRQREDYVPDEQACAECGSEVKARVAGDRYCLDCATLAADGTDQSIELI